MSIRLIALDLDGTLVNSRWEISEKDLQALAAASERGIQVVVVTGRRPRAAAPYVAKIPFPVTTITSNGALVRTSTAGRGGRRSFTAGLDDRAGHARCGGVWRQWSVYRPPRTACL